MHTFYSSMQLFSCSRETARIDKPRQKLLKKRFGCGAGPLKGRSRRIGSSVAVVWIETSVFCVGPSADTNPKFGTDGTCPLYSKFIEFAWQESAFELSDERCGLSSGVVNSLYSISNAGKSICTSWQHSISLLVLMSPFKNLRIYLKKRTFSSTPIPFWITGFLTRHKGNNNNTFDVKLF